MKAKKLLISTIALTSFFIGLFAKAPHNSQAATINPVGQGSGWSLTFNDDFNGTALNRNIWRSDYFPNGGNGEMQQYVSDDSHNNYIVQNGMLQIVARKETLNGQPYTSGIIHTKGTFEQKYGYFEIRAQVPAGKGYWPAFWMLPDQDNWVPEIDVTEILGDKPGTTYMTLHYNNTSGVYTQYQGVYNGPDFSAGWHTFAVDWEPAYLIYYVDGVERYRVTDTTAIPNMPLYVIANLAVGGNWPGAPDSSTVFPGYYNIDYVRAWQKTSAPTATSVPATATQTATSSPSGSNMISNASFETAGASPWYTPWAFRNDLGAVFTQDTSTAANSTRASLKAYLPKSNNTQPWVVAVNQPDKALTGGQSYTLSFMAKASAARGIRAVVQLQNSPYTELTNKTANLTTTWARYTFNFTPSSSTSTAMVNFNLAGAKGTVWLDEVSLCLTGVSCTTSTATAPTPTSTAVYLPTVTKIPPTATPTTAAATTPNLVTNASFELSGVSPWYSPWALRNDLGAVFSQDTTTAAGGTGASFKASLSSSNSSQPWVVGINQANKALSGGTSYTITFWAKASATRSILAVVQLQNSPYTELANQAANLTTAWTRYTFTFTPTSSTTAAMLNFNLAGATGSVWLDDVSLCQTGFVCQ